MKELLPLIRENKIKGIAHATGGGFDENLPRMFGNGLAAEIAEGSWGFLPIFKVLEEQGKIKHEEMYQIFNMGLGMVLAVAPDEVENVLSTLPEVILATGLFILFFTDNQKRIKKKTIHRSFNLL